MNRVNLSTFRLLGTLSIVLFLNSGCSAQDQAQTEIVNEWEAAKREYYAAIQRSHQEVIAQFELVESQLRAKKSANEVEALIKQRMAFEDKLLAPSGMLLGDYQVIRQNAKKSLEEFKGQLLTRLLKAKAGSLAEAIQAEFDELADSKVADAKARWLIAVGRYKVELESAKELITLQFDVREANARESANISLLDAIQKDRQEFSENGQISTSIDSKRYFSKLEAMKSDLKYHNTEMVRFLLMAQRDKQAKSLKAEFDTFVASVESGNSNYKALPENFNNLSDSQLAEWLLDSKWLVKTEGKDDEVLTLLRNGQFDVNGALSPFEHQRKNWRVTSGDSFRYGFFDHNVTLNFGVSPPVFDGKVTGGGLDGSTSTGRYLGHAKPLK